MELWDPSGVYLESMGQGKVHAEWYKCAKTGHFLNDPACSFSSVKQDHEDQINEVCPELSTRVLDGNSKEICVPDLRKIGLLGCQWIVSCKCNTNLFNHTNAWKKTVW